MIDFERTFCLLQKSVYRIQNRHRFRAFYQILRYSKGDTAKFAKILNKFIALIARKREEKLSRSYLMLKFNTCSNNQKIELAASKLQAMFNFNKIKAFKDLLTRIQLKKTLTKFFKKIEKKYGNVINSDKNLFDNKKSFYENFDNILRNVVDADPKSPDASEIIPDVDVNLIRRRNDPEDQINLFKCLLFTVLINKLLSLRESSCKSEGMTSLIKSTIYNRLRDKKLKRIIKNHNSLNLRDVLNKLRCFNTKLQKNEQSLKFFIEKFNSFKIKRLFIFWKKFQSKNLSNNPSYNFNVGERIEKETRNPYFNRFNCSQTSESLPTKENHINEGLRILGYLIS